MNTFIFNISDNSESYVKVSEAELHSIDEGLEEAKKGVFIPHNEVMKKITRTHRERSLREKTFVYKFLLENLKHIKNN